MIRTTTISGCVALALLMAAASTVSGAQTAPPAKSQAAKPAADHGLAITFKTDPAPPKMGSNRFEVTVKDAAGKPVVDADVSVVFVMAAMPAMKMPEMRKETKLKASAHGKYSGAGEVMMSGHWDVTVVVKQKGVEVGSKKLTVDAK